MRRTHDSVLRQYEALGTSYAEPVSSLAYSLASDLGREDNDLLWHAVVGVSSFELYGRGLMGVAVNHTESKKSFKNWHVDKAELIRQVMRDEVRRLNPPELQDSHANFNRADALGVIPTTARSPTDTSIRLSPEPKFLLIRHWSLYDSMLHSPYLSARLHIWTDAGRKRLNKLLAKMGVSLTQSKQNYTHMDMDLKRTLRVKLLKYAPIYGLDGVVPVSVEQNRTREGWGFVRSWGWKACLSAVDVAVIVGSILEVGRHSAAVDNENQADRTHTRAQDEQEESEEWIGRFWDAYDGLDR
jgi:cell division control protein 45